MIITDKNLIDIALKEYWGTPTDPVFVEYEGTARARLGEIEGLVKKICHPLGRKFEMIQVEDDAVSFSIDGYPFDLSWFARREKAPIGDREIIRLYFLLSKWVTTPATRDDPGDCCDVPVAISPNFYDIIRHAFVMVATEIVNNVFEGEMLAQHYQEGTKDESF